VHWNSKLLHHVGLFPCALLQPLPDALRGEQWAFVQLPLRNLQEMLKKVEQVGAGRQAGSSDNDSGNGSSASVSCALSQHLQLYEYQHTQSNASLVEVAPVIALAACFVQLYQQHAVCLHQLHQQLCC
jgi:hypothetical protein